MMTEMHKKTGEFSRRWEYIKTRYYQWIKQSDRKTALIVLLAFSIIAAYLTIPDTALSFLPTAPSDIGKVMKFSVRADRDYEVQDTEQTDKKQAEALRKVLHHYTYQDRTATYQKMRKAFAAMRQKAAGVLIEKGLPDATPVPQEWERLNRAALEANLPLIVPENLRGAVYLAIDGHRKEFEKQIGMPMDSDLFAALRAGFFSLDIEEAVFAVIERLDNFYILRDGPGKGYYPDRIAVHKGANLINRPLHRVITDLSLPAEIANTQRLLRQENDLTGKGLALIAATAHALIADNLLFDEESSRKAREEALAATPPVLIRIKNGEIIARAGDIVNRQHIAVFREIAEKKKDQPTAFLFIEHLLFIAFTLAVGFLSFRRSISKFSTLNKDILLMALLAIVSIGFTYGIAAISVPFSQWIGNIDPRIFNFLLPFPFVVATVRLLINSETALFFIISIMLLFANVFPDNYYFPAYYTISALFYLFLITHVDRRSHVLRASLSLGTLQVLLTILIFLMDSTLPHENLFRGLIVAFSSGLISGLLLLGLIPLWEGLFAYTTDISYLELTSMQHPLMARLVTEANGSYQHSLMVGVMVEEAARRIRVNPLACKVMAYYHDIGKLHGPHYYVENQSSFNIHDTLEPAESARIIKSHIAHGLELARDHKLGEKIEAAVRQHHGTSLVKFFYEKATQRDPHTPEADYRYIGPKPQAKDVGLIMLADSVEAAIRSMKEKNYQKICDGVRNIIARIIADGQLSDCNMTMRDLALIEESFIKTLAGQYHARVEYQQPVA